MDAKLIKQLQAECHSLRLLYVEDDEELSLSTQRMLQSFFTNIVVAYDGVEGLEAYKKEPFDIVLTDILMPNMDGSEMIREIHKIKSQQAIIVMSAYEDSEHLLELIDIGIDKFISKPAPLEKLIRSFLTVATNINNAKKVAILSEETKRTLAQKESILSRILDTAPVRIFWKDRESRYLGCNKLFAQDAGFRDQSDIIGKSDYDLSWSADADAYVQDDREVIETGEDKLDFQEDQSAPDGKRKWLSTSKVAMRDEEGNIVGVLGTYVDISKEKEIISQMNEAKEKLNYQAYHDSLTGLPNRLLFYDRLQHAMKEANRYDKKIAVMFMDLDYFKTINDSLGHESGDKVLQYLAELLQKVLRSVDTVARFGGDEFVILLDAVESVDDVFEVIQKIMQALQTPYHIKQHSIHLRVSLGISIYPDDSEDAQTLIRNADSAMYRAKDEGRDTYQFYKKEMTDKVKEHIVVVENLSKAIENSELELYYQPQIDGSDASLVGMEALIRWNSPTLGFVSPANFIPIAESSGLIDAIGEWVFETAVKQMVEWRKKGYKTGRVAINFSAIELQQENFVENIAKKLQELECDSEWIELEITESYTMKHPEDAIKKLHALQDLGIRLTMDDFGTGYSSLSYLKKIPLYKLKIDQSFVRDLTDGENDVAIVESIISLAKTMGFDVIAEGVETKEQLDILLEKGCKKIQGYYFSKPLPLEKMEAFIKKNQI